jgi:hypothetical protein
MQDSPLFHPLTLLLSPMRLCRNEGNAMFVILNEALYLLGYRAK